MHNHRQTQAANQRQRKSARGVRDIFRLRDDGLLDRLSEGKTAASCKLESVCEELLGPLSSLSSSPQSTGTQMSPLIPHL